MSYADFEDRAERAYDQRRTQATWYAYGVADATDDAWLEREAQNFGDWAGLQARAYVLESRTVLHSIRHQLHLYTSAYRPKGGDQTCASCSRGSDSTETLDNHPTREDTQTMTLPTLPEHNVYRLARMAECYSPAKETSAGGDFLTMVQVAILEAVRWTAENDTDGDLLHAIDNVRDDQAHQIADGAVPVHTYERWQAFTDLGAFEEDPHGEGLADATTNLTETAGVCLYMIAERLVHALLSEYEDYAKTEED